tara:strand:+ start:199 stop:1260 length:1062 start_codon:yes stop_codon:yes gene_type:complete
MSQINTNAILDASGGTTTSINGYTPTASNMAGRNRIINGCMRIWQRGTSFSNVSTTNNYYTADRWGANRSSNASGLTVSQSTDVPAGFKYSAKFQREASNTATNALSIFNSNESINTLDFANQSVTFSFYAKVGANWSASNDINVVIRSGTGTDQRAYQFTGLVSQPSTVTITNSWVKYSITKTVPANATEVGVMIQSGAYSGTAGADDSLYITGVQLEAGSVATPFEYRQYGQELALCQRYCLAFDNRPTPTNNYYVFGVVRHTSATSAIVIQSFPVRMRTKPTSATFSATVPNTWFVDPGVTNFTTVAIDQNSDLGGCFNLTGGSGLTTGQSGRALSNANAPAYVIWEVEL